MGELGRLGWVDVGGKVDFWWVVLVGMGGWAYLLGAVGMGGLGVVEMKQCWGTSGSFRKLCGQIPVTSIGTLGMGGLVVVEIGGCWGRGGLCRLGWVGEFL